MTKHKRTKQPAQHEAPQKYPVVQFVGMTEDGKYKYKLYYLTQEELSRMYDAHTHIERM